MGNMNDKARGHDSRVKAWKLVTATVLLALPLAAHAASCTSQAGMSAPGRSALAESSLRLLTAISQQDFTTLRAALLTTESGDWAAIHSAAEQAVPLVAGGQMRLRNLYLVDASSAKSTADTQVFCSNSSGSLTVTLSLSALPPGKYAVVLADATGAKLAGQIGLVLGLEGGVWRLGGLSAHAGALDEQDGIWYWTRARELARSAASPSGTLQVGLGAGSGADANAGAGVGWSAAFTYDIANYLLVPFSFISSPNLEKLSRERAQIKDAPTFPVTLTDGPRSWKLSSIHLDASLHHPDLGVRYETMGATDPASSRTEALAVLGALLKAQPALRKNFHGLWAYATKDGKQTFAIELPMDQIP